MNQKKTYAYAQINGNQANGELNGDVYFYPCSSGGTWIEIEVTGLPNKDIADSSNFYGLHIHEKGDCSLPFDKTGGHYNKANAPHPEHSGDLPPLLGNEGYAYSYFYTNRFNVGDIVGRSIIVHSKPDDFTSQPAGNSGDKIACGVIRMN